MQKLRKYCKARQESKALWLIRKLIRFRPTLKHHEQFLLRFEHFLITVDLSAKKISFSEKAFGKYSLKCNQRQIESYDLMERARFSLQLAHLRGQACLHA